MESKFIYSKVILSGEHSVLRGGGSIVAPNKNFAFAYNFKKSDSFKMTYSEEVQKYDILFLGTVERGLELLSLKEDSIKVSVHIDSIVPLGSGLGGSAALCVFVAKLFHFSDLIPKENIFNFAHNIEDMFHGKSSGLDIAGCITDNLIFYKKGEYFPIQASTKLKGLVFTVHESGESGDTKSCINQVLKLKKTDPTLFLKLDTEMSDASEKLKKGFETGAIELIVDSFEKTKSIFRRWGLETEGVRSIYEKLFAKNALACRVSGSGMGGAVVAMWNKESLPFEFKDSVFLGF